MQIDFSTAFDRVNHQGILCRLSSVVIGGSVLSVLTQFLPNRSQFVLVDGCRSKLVIVVSGVPQGSVLDPLLFLMATVTSMGKQTGQKGTIQHHYNNDDLLEGKTPTSLSTLKMNNKCFMKTNRHEFKGQTNSSRKHINNNKLIINNELLAY